jgi:hypothetical protein
MQIQTPIKSSSRSYNSLEEREKNIAVLWQAFKIVQKLKSQKKEDWYGLPVKVVADWQKLAFSEFYGMKLDKWERQEILYNLFHEIHMESRERCRKLLFPADMSIFEQYLNCHFNAIEQREQQQSLQLTGEVALA